VFLYTKETYYWNKSLPTYEAFKPRAFSGTNDLDALSTEVDANCRNTLLTLKPVNRMNIIQMLLVMQNILLLTMEAYPAS
jgi:hypothetical protein